MSPSDQPLEFRLTLSREEAVAFLEKLAREDAVRAEFEQNPYGVLAENGIEVTPAEAMPSTVVAPNREDIESAIATLAPDQDVEGWNAQVQWTRFPLVGLLAKPMEGGGSESS